MKLYPKYKYHAELPPTVVDSLDAEDALGEGWRDAPHTPAPELAPEPEAAAMKKKARAR